MSIENEIQDLTQSTTDLLNAVNTKKVTLDNAVSQAQTAVTDATSQVSLAAAEKVGAQTARDEAETHKNQAYTYSQSAASAVAYQDLTAIAQTKAESAVDVFVYDTSKDSDGGAWRHRTQHTSWYNEPLNTSTRGSRKEFPAVAVIVAEAYKITIYDGDDPSLPMWMVFNNSSTGNIMRNHSTNVVNSVSMFNGILCFGSDGWIGLWEIPFIADYARQYRHSPSSSTYYQGNIAERNSSKGFDDGSFPSSIVNATVNDVAMTVLPDAPIDPATGLPIPTIAVATDGGVSVIKDDGTVVDITFGNDLYEYVDSIDFTEDNKIIFFSDNSANYRFTKVYSIPTSDIAETAWTIKGSADENYTGTIGSPSIDADMSFLYNGGGGSAMYARRNIGTPINLVRIAQNDANPSSGLLAQVSSTYNTGWMNGDIKLATLSDTDDTDLVGSELVTNGTFDTDTSGWTAVNSTLSVDSGQLVITGTNSSNGNQGAYYEIAHEPYQEIVVEFEITELTANPANAGIIVSGGQIAKNNNLHYWYVGSTGKFSTSVKLDSGTTTNITLHAGTNVGVITKFDNISVRLAEPDRSVNNNGLQVFGTVQKNPVATGADLVAYRGFGPSNYLVQPYNPDLDFGTGDFCVMWWASSNNDTYYTIIDNRNDSFVTGLNVQTIPVGSTSKIRVYLQNIYRDSLEIPELVSSFWSCFCVVRKGDTLSFYVNGRLHSQQVEQAIGDRVVAKDDSSAMRIGVRKDGQQTLEGSLALLRISATAPTAEQIERIYQDEKVLFQENAKATLHGTSDAVTALAYDDTTELLHVGTSAGRSVFQGLRRVDNTTDAVGVAISVSNGLVVEE